MTELVFENRHGHKPLVELGELLGEGVAGRIYTVRNATNVVAKLYKEKSDLAIYSKKIRAMVQAPPNLPPFQFHDRTYVQIAWPLGPVSSRSDEFLGFLMPEVDTTVATELENILQRKQRKRKGLPEFYGGRVLLAANLAALMAELHSLGHFMIDMKPANIRFYPHSWYLAILDTDGFSVGGPERLPAEHFTEEYIAPEAVGESPQGLGLGQDLFALATIIFRLLNNGVHPFQGVDSVSGLPTAIQPRIFEGLYPYGLSPSAKVKPSKASIHEYFERDTRELFDRAFTTKDRRPSAEEWRAHLADLISGGRLVKCTKHSDEHAHFSKGCGLCAVESNVSALRAAAPPRPAQAKAQPASAGGSTSWGRPGLVLGGPTPTQVVPPQAPRVQKRGMSAGSWVALLGLGLFAAIVLGSVPHKPRSTVVTPQISQSPITAPAPDTSPSTSGSRESEQTEAWLQEERRKKDAEEAERKRNSFTFQVKSNYPDKVLLTFYSKDQSRAWPGNGEYYVLQNSETRTYDLNCTFGEQICYGAWADDGALSPSWGSGYKGRSGCTNCCYQCNGGTSAPIVLNRANSFRPPPSKTFRVMSQHYSTLLIAFYTGNGRSGWPGGDTGSRVGGYMINDSSVHTYRLNCRRGEKICFGAWEHQNPYGAYWGCGPRCVNRCVDCCYICDGEETNIINLTSSRGLE